MGYCIDAFVVFAAAFLSVVFRPQVARISFIAWGGWGDPRALFSTYFSLFYFFVTVFGVLQLLLAVLVSL